jgi:hypothetical protein
MMMLKQVAGTTGTSSVYGIEIPKQSSGSELFFFSFSNNNEIQMKMKQNNRTTNKIDERIIMNNN